MHSSSGKILPRCIGCVGSSGTLRMDQGVFKRTNNLQTVPNAFQSRRPTLRTRKQADCKAHRSQDGKFDLRDWSESVSKDLRSRFEQQRTKVAGASAGLLLTAFLAGGGPALASDFVKVGTCLFGNCQGALASCLVDGECVENLICLQKCNNRPDEADCQIRCGDLYADKAIEAFTACAVSDKKCVPQKVDVDKYPVPKDSILDEKFELNDFQGRWYITAGLNPLFDQFDCQEHYFGVPEPKKLVGQIRWRIPKQDKDFIERNTVQTFRQVSSSPAKLENHGNAFLHYSDDWYILGYKPDTYAVIYYIGNNDAWKGYGGATVYSRASSFPEEYRDEIEASLKPMNLSLSDFKITDNTCKPHPIQLNPLKRLEEFAEEEVEAVEGEFLKDLKSFGKGFTVLEQNIARELTAEEKLAEREIREAEDFILNLRSKRSDGALKQDQTMTPNPFVQFFKNFRFPPVQVKIGS